MQSRAEGNFLKSEHLERKKQDGTTWQRAKEQRLVFIHSLVHLQVKPWQSDSTCSSFAVLDAVLQCPELSSNPDSWIDRGSVSCFSYGVALALVPHWGCHLVFTHPTAMDGSFRSETIYAVTRLDWWLGVGYGERGWFGSTRGSV